MKLPSPFYRLPLVFDVSRLRHEVAQFAEQEWQRHPTGFAGNSAVRLISADGGENDAFVGHMMPTPQLQRCPYIQQVLAGFRVVVGRSRLMRLAPGASVPPHSDVNYCWFHRIRIHIPVFTSPRVSFSCGGQTVHMAAGEAWVFDNWREHTVHNGGDADRVHLVVDTTGNAAFWNMVEASQSGGFESWSGAEPKLVPYGANAPAPLFFEKHNAPVVMQPSEVELLTGDLLAELLASPASRQQRDCQRFASLATGFCREWRALWLLYGESPEGWSPFAQLRDYMIAQLENLRESPVCPSNGVSAAKVLFARVLSHAVRELEIPTSLEWQPPAPGEASAVRRGGRARNRFPKPLFIVAAPRSGSTLLFETLAQAHGIYSLGGEAHGLVEDLPQLRPWAEGVGSNRLTSAHVTQEVVEHIQAELAAKLRDRDGQALPAGDARFLEKTPKNALRIPFFNALFPDARFIFLWRDPRESLSSIMEAWRSGGWKTYSELPDWDGPWSMLVPPGYRALRGRPLEEVAAFQWERTNEIALDDLSQLPAERWTTLCYADLLADPAGVTRKICETFDIEFDDRHAAYLHAPLPLSRHTLTPPAPGKWRVNEAAISRMLPSLEGLVRRLAGLGAVKG
ncbi:MAG TPA: sulfotransferase [Nevskia sp.]|nr:sulfotransferase [Nevskia sp.]